jgi:hypothetical protein
MEPGKDILQQRFSLQKFGFRGKFAYHFPEKTIKPSFCIPVWWVFHFRLGINAVIEKVIDGIDMVLGPEGPMGFQSEKPTTGWIDSGRFENNSMETDLLIRRSNSSKKSTSRVVSVMMRPYWCQISEKVLMIFA